MVTRKIKEIPDKIPKVRELERKPLPNEFEKVGEETMNIFEHFGFDKAQDYIENALTEKRIYKNHAEQIKQILELFVKQ